MHIRRVPPQLESLGRILDLPLPARMDRDAGADLASGEASDADSPAPDVEIVICPPVGAAYRYE